MKKSASSLAAQRRDSTHGPAAITTWRGISQPAVCIIPPPDHDSTSQSTGPRSFQTSPGRNTVSDTVDRNRAQAPDAMAVASARSNRPICASIFCGCRTSSASRYCKYSPRDASKAVLRAPHGPRFSCAMTRTPRPSKLRATPRLPSVEPSSTTTTSILG